VNKVIVVKETMRLQRLAFLLLLAAAARAGEPTATLTAVAIRYPRKT
jgi:hypothetical protein